MKVENAPFCNQILLPSSYQTCLRVSCDNVISFDPITYLCAYKHLQCRQCNTILGLIYLTHNQNTI